MRGLSTVFGRVLRKDESGIAAVEFGIIAPVLVLLTVCTSDLGLAIYSDMQMQNAAQAGADYALVHATSGSVNLGSVRNAITAATGCSWSSNGCSGITASASQFCGCPGANGVTNVGSPSGTPPTCSAFSCSGNPAGMYVTATASTTYATLLSYPIIPAKFNFIQNSTVRVQ